MPLLRSGLNRAAGIGVLSGLFFAFSSLFLRRASLSLGDPDSLATAPTTLVTVVSKQVVLLGGWVLATRSGALTAIARAWTACVFVRSYEERWVGKECVRSSRSWRDTKH